MSAIAEPVTAIAEAGEVLNLNPQHVISGVNISEGHTNASDEEIVANIRHSIKLGHPQVWSQGLKPGRVVIVGGGPSLELTVDELQELYFEGAFIVTVNGSYKWCVERNIRPSAQVVVDARASNARFLEGVVPKCNYYLASQCHKDSWDMVAGREQVGIFHAVGPEGDDSEAKRILNDYYLKNWQGVAGGTTVTTRALGLLRTLGFLRFDLFGVDSCYLDGKDHSYNQPENANDRVLKVNAGPESNPELSRIFACAPWHLKQLEDFLRFIKTAGDNFLLNVHGEGLLAHALKTNAAIAVEE